MTSKKIPRLVNAPHVFCPGCGHGIVNRLIAEVIEELGYDRKTILTLGVGCSLEYDEILGRELSSESQREEGWPVPLA